MFIGGNKRVAMIFANKIMIDNGCGINFKKITRIF